MKPKLLLHTGTPKTGTKTVQSALHASRERLLAFGILYPDVDLSFEFKHQWMVNLLLAGDYRAFRANVQRVSMEAAEAGARVVVLSTEGLFLHWTDFDAAARSELAALTTEFDVTIWTAFREPVSFAKSLYSQVLKNPPSHLSPCYATTLSFEDAVRHPWFTARLDYQRFIEEIEALLGEGRLKATQYGAADTLSQAREVLGVDEATVPGVPSRNQGMNAIGADLLRRLNAVPLEPTERQRLVKAVVEIDRLVGAGTPLEASPTVIEAVSGASRQSLSYLAERFGIQWPARAAVTPANTRAASDATSSS